MTQSTKFQFFNLLLYTVMGLLESYDSIKHIKRKINSEKSQ